MFTTIVSAGDDYEILAAVAPDNIAALENAVGKSETGMRRIGTIVDGAGVVVQRGDGAVITFDRTGWEHF